ncbi:MULTISPECIES: TetR/AcrR family transcriptional regulator [Exiguobacterium]|uniref:TetR/AcrR family transcriptional regulator n=1 Tax=Exiguobacterium TaxID=33986 RepID=UPI001BEBD93F|nr:MULTISPECIES: TetR/AcrR family transcriptional regulator [Exiguobacterium]MCT4782082.1 TetR/AcrR family transcriptional regulator [Exiguobacterium himgiriensis]
MDGFIKRTEEKREAILLAAHTLMRQKQSRFTISELARAASVSPVSIYNYFGSKEQVILLVLTRLTESEMGWIERQIERHVPFDVLLIDILKRKIDTAILFDDTVLATVTSDPSWHELAARGYAAFRQLIEYGKTSGAIEATVSTDAYLRYVQLMQQAILSDPALSTAHMTETMNEYYHFFLHGIMKKND